MTDKRATLVEAQKAVGRRWCHLEVRTALFNLHSGVTLDKVSDVAGGRGDLFGVVVSEVGAVGRSGGTAIGAGLGHNDAGMVPGVFANVFAAKSGSNSLVMSVAKGPGLVVGADTREPRLVLGHLFEFSEQRISLLFFRAGISTVFVVLGVDEKPSNGNAVRTDVINHEIVVGHVRNAYPVAAIFAVL